MQVNPLMLLRNSKCKLCDLHKLARTVCIMGKGNPNAKLMLIGEAPGEEEDKSGIVFIGKAGKMLDSILTTLGITLEDVYITNIIKCHPPFNSKPNISKLDICAIKYLRKEIQLIQPELIVCLGGLAAKTLMREPNIVVALVRNSVYYTQGPLPGGIPFIVTYHPAATFHQDNLLEFIINDLEWAQRLIKGELPKPKRKTNYLEVENLSDIPNISDAEWLDLDLETDGLDPFLPNKDILSLQISLEEGKAYYLDWTEQVGSELRGLLHTKTHEFVHKFRVNGHNIKFDLKWLRVKAGIVFNGTINDTIQNIHLLDENFPAKDLDTVATTYTELKGHKDKFKRMIKAYVKMHKESGEPIRKAEARLWKRAFYSISMKTRIAYGCGDADATGRLRRRFKEDINAKDLLPLHTLMMNVTKVYVDMECNGFKIDTRLIDDFRDDYEMKLNRMEARLNKLAPIELNHNAPLQLRQLIYSKWKCYPHEIRMGKKRVRYSTGKDALELILKDEITDEIKNYLTELLEFRKLGKLYSTYIQGMPKYLRSGFVHADWRLDGVDTGRTSCSNPNLQQIPRTGDIKRMFISRYSDGVLMQVDASQGELRIAAHEANEKNLIRLFKHSADIHSAVAASSLHKLQSDVTEEERYIYKTVNFLILYEGGIKTLAQEIKKDIKSAAQILRSWHKQFPDWKTHVESVQDFVITNNYVRNMFGRYRHLFIMDPTTDEGRTALRKAVNAPIQSGLSDWIKLCGYNTWIELRKIPECLFVSEGHDQWVFDMHSKDVPTVAQIIKEGFENVDTSDFGFKFRVPMKVEIKVGPNWKEMELYEV